MNNLYYLIIDNSVQWFCYIITVNNDKIIETYAVDSNIKGPYLKSIFSRELHFSNRQFKPQGSIDTYYGWTISETEYNHIKKLIELYPKYIEYCRSV